MFSLLRKKDSLSQSSKVSTSCPSINSPGNHDQSSTVSHDSSASSDTDEEDIPKASRSQRMFARKSIRRQRKREKEFEKKLKHNKITMDDYLNKQGEFKLWLQEEKNKVITDIKSPKTKAYFKSFVKLWNKKKLLQKYYRGTISCETPPNCAGKPRPAFLSLADSPFPNSVTFPQTIDLSHEGSILSDSPFSTFGKSPGNTSVTKTPGSGHDLLDLKRKAIFNNINKENNDELRDDQVIPVQTKHKPTTSSSSESSGGSTSDSPKSSKSTRSSRSSKSSTSRQAKEDENLYKVTVLSWTSKGELQVRPSSASPNLPDSQHSGDVRPGGCMSSTQYSTIAEQHNTSIPYKEVDDAVDMHDPTYCIVGFPSANYSEPYNCIPQPNMKVDNTPSNLNQNGNTSSIEDLYAVPIKKKKSADQSETVSLTSNESATNLDRKVSNHVGMEKLSDIASSGSDFSITSGSSTESLNHPHLLTVPGQDAIGKASSAPELSTVFEGDVTKFDDRTFDDKNNFTNVTAINMTGLNSFLDPGNTTKLGDKPQFQTFRGEKMDTAFFGTPDRKRNLSDPSRQVLFHQDQSIKSTKRTLSDPTSPGNLLETGKSSPRASLPTPPPPPLQGITSTPNVSSGMKNKTNEKRPPPPLRGITSTPNVSSGTENKTSERRMLPLIPMETPIKPEAQRSNSESWPTPPTDLEDLESKDDRQLSASESWPTPPAPLYENNSPIIDSKLLSPPPPPNATQQGLVSKLPSPPPPPNATQQGLDSKLLSPPPPPSVTQPGLNSKLPSPPPLPKATQQTPDSVFENTKEWPTPPSPYAIEDNKKESDDEPPQLVTADFITQDKTTQPVSNQPVQNRTTPLDPIPPVLQISQIPNIQVDPEDGLISVNNKTLLDNQSKSRQIIQTEECQKNTKDSKPELDIQDKENQSHKPTDGQGQKQTENQGHKPTETHKLTDRQISTTSIERLETDIDAVTDSPEIKDNTLTKKRLVLETVV